VGQRDIRFENNELCHLLKGWIIKRPVINCNSNIFSECVNYLKGVIILIVLYVLL